MVNNQITPFQLTDQFTMDNFNQRINETNTALQNKADLGEDGKVTSSQLPDMDYAPSTHASQHAIGGSDPITPESIGAAPAYTYGTEDLTAGTSPLETGKLYFVYE